MKESKKKPPKQKTVGKPASSEFRVPYPLLWLSLVVLLLYGSSINLGFTELDDSIFIRETKSYNADLSNLITSFRRGVFNVTEDIYYRPLLLDSFILNYQFNGIDIKGYHVVNVLLHLISVLLLFILFKKLRIKQLHAFLLTLIFAVHPVLSQAVAWIPGRNDTLLGVFTFTFLVSMISYSSEGKIHFLILQFLALLAAFFTKETTVFAAPVAFVILLFVLNKSWREKRNLILYGSWLLAFLSWFYIRSQATLQNSQMQPAEILRALPARCLVLVQYLGKIILPVNLSVFPIMKDTSYVYGIISIVLLAAAVYFFKGKNLKIISGGLAVYFLFLIPVLLVPNTLNDQDFEHRLYLPIIGILIVLSETAVFKNHLSDRTLLVGGLAFCFLLAIVNFNHQKKFNDAISFWKEAVRTSPHSAYANMMLGARLDQTDLPKAQSLIRTAYELNPDEKYVNYYMGKMMLDKDSVAAAEKYFQTEIKRSDYYECYFHLARISFEKKNYEQAIDDLNKYLAVAPDEPQGNNNLLLLYLQTKKLDKAKVQVARMRQLGLEIPPEVIDQLK